MILNEWASCPSCKMCANFSDFKKVLENDPVCPMCDQHVPPMSVKISEDSQGDFKALVALMKDPTATEGDENGADSDEDELLG